MKRTSKLGIFATAACIMTAALLPAQVQAKPTACDYAAAHPDDPDKVLPGFERAEIDLPAAEVTCREVLEEMPDHARTNYLLGRVLFYQQRQMEALPFLEAAEDAGYRQSIFVLGYIDKEGFIESADACRGLERLRRGVSLEHPWSGYHVVDGTLSGKFADCESPPDSAELERAMALVSENVTVAASEGRIEALMKKLADSKGSEG